MFFITDESFWFPKRFRLAYPRRLFCFLVNNKQKSVWLTGRQRSTSGADREWVRPTLPGGMPQSSVQSLSSTPSCIQVEPLSHMTSPDKLRCHDDFEVRFPDKSWNSQDISHILYQSRYFMDVIVLLDNVDPRCPAVITSWRCQR